MVIEPFDSGLKSFFIEYNNKIYLVTCFLGSAHKSTMMDTEMIDKK